MTAAEAYLDLRAVEAYLGTRRVFDNLSLRLHLGENSVILGPNGAGKSALIKLLSREIYPVVKPGSHLRLFGRETVNLWDLRARIGLVSRDLLTGYVGAVPARDVVLSGFFGSVGIGPSQHPSPGQRQRVQELMIRLGLEDLATRSYRQLSDGQRMRLLLARALVHNPQVLVLDEPTTGLDLRAKHQLLQILRELAQSGTTLLLVTHQIEAIIPEISRCLMLRQGSLVADGPVDELLADGPLSELFETPLQVCSAGGYRQVLPAPSP
ncbi:ATP-binding cassette domain-containing protein [Synechococcus sp. Cruz-9H2]|uniref:ABC transporter ATP-binding protein n=1 Tax=unclassified Synechococcus TaxID=2626047 RepID=UPI0020CF420A|nr:MULTISPECIES: ATP-binding cassette domain-containing protein [unclassified Synechococcus]MCP9818553.1 ATP-binding cassette domain-containing protein [Synechococcus sp. Cruz-9H2]MCP9842784.1 ATP-binding cassette domain-containing protein [Synechococcus sp. Edmonson 11F2]MCP9855449.1 ATP-binding cassette domain-containing protein [Synechococcus sp. Cruz-9C9]MCP9862304.1 ATP-binding cassette domain-containing protein [Synechococcus sp. Cruz-7E5]MCP9869576.1 ATP-binding cassette domain-containi